MKEDYREEDKAMAVVREFKYNGETYYKFADGTVLGEAEFSIYSEAHWVMIIAD